MLLYEIQGREAVTTAIIWMKPCYACRGRLATKGAVTSVAVVHNVDTVSLSMFGQGYTESGLVHSGLWLFLTFSRRRAFSEKAKKQAEKLKGTYKSGRYEMTNFLRRAFNIVFDMFAFLRLKVAKTREKSHMPAVRSIFTEL